jgi:formylglycine-generating enzyme required for sulfatase activity
MRKGLSALCSALLLCGAASVIAAEDTTTAVDPVAQALLDIEQRQTEVTETGTELNLIKQALDNAKIKQARLATEAAQLEKKRKAAQNNLDRDYSRMLDEPDLDISASQTAYQKSWEAIKDHQQSVLNNQHQVQELTSSLLVAQAAQKRNLNALEQSKESHIRARVERLREEIKGGQITDVDYTHDCDTSMTIAQCADQSQTLAIQKAVSLFQDTLIEGTTEIKQVKRHLGEASLNIHVVGQSVKQAQLFGDNKYRTAIDVQLESRPATNAPCRLLDVASSYCFAPSNSSSESGQSQEVQWVNLNIRSNQYDDQVWVDGVSYGSTPIDVMLPVGIHRVTVSKEGYKSFNQDLTIRGDHTLRAVLREHSNLPKSGKTFADTLKDKSNAPTMVVIQRGEYAVGENASQTALIKRSYAIGQTPVTVAQFGRFVEEASYQTDPEVNKSCLEFSTNTMTPMVNSSWRSPGFKQAGNSPVVCVSRTDAQAYATWLSSQTGFTYRLPTAYEWEVAARAGTKTQYWWGNDFGTSRANTGWGGTNWSNRSTSPVKSFSANAWGMYDTVGNVWEWINSPEGVAKGGAWSFAPSKATAAESMYVNPNSGANFLGLRLVREIN